MMNESEDTSTLVQRFNDEKARHLIPAVVYICLLMVSGIPGNLMVLYYYGRKTQTSTTSIFITTLAVYDFIVCSVTMPHEISDLVKMYTFVNVAACKILTFINYVAAIGSVLTLITIAVDRYKHICRATGKQMTVKDVRRYCAMTVVVTLLFSWPALLLYTPVKVPIPNNLGLDLKGSDCTMIKDKAYSPYTWAFNTTHAIIFHFCLTLLLVLYIVIGRTIHKHQKRMARYSYKVAVSRSTTYSTDPDSQTVMSDVPDFEESSVNQDQNVDEKKKHCSSKKIQNQTELVRMNSQKQRFTMETKQGDGLPNTNEGSSAKPDFDRQTVRITMLMITIAVVFILSCLPYFCLTIWRAYEGKHEAEFLSDAGLVGFMIGQRSYLLNSSLNPWLYGIFGSRFRHFYYKLLCCKR